MADIGLKYAELVHLMLFSQCSSCFGVRSSNSVGNPYWWQGTSCSCGMGNICTIPPASAVLFAINGIDPKHSVGYIIFISTFKVNLIRRPLLCYLKDACGWKINCDPGKPYSKLDLNTQLSRLSSYFIFTLLLKISQILLSRVMIWVLLIFQITGQQACLPNEPGFDLQENGALEIIPHVRLYCI